MRVAINLSTRPFTDLGPALRRLRFAIGGLALIAAALGVGLHFLHNAADAARARERYVDQSITRVNSEHQQYMTLAAQPDNAEVLSHVSALNKLIDLKAFSWTLAMEDLETVLPGGVQVTTLEPVVDKKDGHITVRLRVVGQRDKAVDLVANLEHSKHFLLPRIVGEAAESNGNGNQGAVEPVSASSRVNFDILADYNPPSPEERKASNRKAQSGNQSETETATKTQNSAAQRQSARQPAAATAPRTGRPGQVRAPNGAQRPVARPRPGGPQ